MLLCLRSYLRFSVKWVGFLTCLVFVIIYFKLLFVDTVAGGFFAPRDGTAIESKGKRKGKAGAKGDITLCKVLTCSRECTKSTPERRCCAEDMFHMISATSDFLEKHDVDFFLWGGTLLGAVRGQDLLESDSDLDLVVSDKGLQLLRKQTEIPYKFWDDWLTGPRPVPMMRGCQNFKDDIQNANDQMETVIAKSKQQIVRLVHHLHDSFYFKNKAKDKFWLDAYPLYHWPLFAKVKSAIQKKNNTYYDFKPYDKVSIRGKQFPVPRDPEKVLATLYGPEWRIPQANFHADSIYAAGYALSAPILLLGLTIAVLSYLVASYVLKCC